MNRVFGPICIATLATLGTVSGVSAGTILAPVSSSANVPITLDSDVDTINQSGLSSTYISGVTDFDIFLAGGPTHNGLFPSNTFNTVGTPGAAQVTYDLGGLFNIESMALWNRGLTTQGIKDFNLVFSTLADFSVSTSVLGLIGGTTGGNDTADADIYSFGPLSASYVRLDILSTYNVLGNITFGEVAFEVVAPVPVPASLPFLVIALGGLTALGRKRKSRQA